tara:strand:- start:82 stop:588 length:507 start_codon:yes stop_codon:yes gene_type:complete
MKNTKILSIDLGTHTGFAISANGIIESGSVDFSRYKGCKSKPADHIGGTFLSFDQWIKNVIPVFKIDCIVYESVMRWSSGDAAKIYGGLRGIMLSRAAKMGIPVYGYGVTHIKKFWTGKGNSKKPAMIAETKKRYPGITLTGDDEADAIAILHLHINQTNGTNEINTA